MITQADASEMTFDQKAAFVATSGVASASSIILWGEMMSFSKAQVSVMQAVVGGVTNPLVYAVGAPVVAALGHEVAKKKLQKQPGYSANRMFYTTPFTSGFGPVV